MEGRASCLRGRGEAAGRAGADPVRNARIMPVRVGCEGRPGTEDAEATRPHGGEPNGRTGGGIRTDVLEGLAIPPMYPGRRGRYDDIADIDKGSRPRFTGHHAEGLRGVVPARDSALTSVLPAVFRPRRVTGDALRQSTLRHRWRRERWGGGSGWVREGGCDPAVWLNGPVGFAVTREGGALLLVLE